MRHDNLRFRTFQFSVSCIRAAGPVLKDPVGRLLANQLVRSGGAVGANYNSACHAKSRLDFASKITVVAEEAAEAAYWLEIFVALALMTDAVAKPLIIESRELAAIAVASARTARRRKVEDGAEM